MRSRRPALALLALVGGIVVAIASQPSQAATRTAQAHRADGKRVAATGALPRPQLFDIHHAAGEPTIGITREGYVAITAGGGCVTSCAEVGEPTFFQTFAPGGRAVFITKNRGRTSRTPTSTRRSSNASRCSPTSSSSCATPNRSRPRR